MYTILLATFFRRYRLRPRLHRNPRPHQPPTGARANPRRPQTTPKAATHQVAAFTLTPYSLLPIPYSLPHRHRTSSSRSFSTSPCPIWISASARSITLANLSPPLHHHQSVVSLSHLPKPNPFQLLLRLQPVEVQMDQPNLPPAILLHQRERRRAHFIGRCPNRRRDPLHQRRLACAQVPRAAPPASERAEAP